MAEQHFRKIRVRPDSGGADHEAAGNAGGSQGQVPGNTDKNRQRGRDGADLFDSVGENSFLDILSLQR